MSSASSTIGAGRLRDRVILVVGGTAGLGLSAVIAIVREGGRVIVVARNPDKGREIETRFNGSVVSVIGDATDPGAVDQAVVRAYEHWGACHGLYHVAGGSGRRWGDGALHCISDEGWRRTMDLNLSSVLYSNRAVLRAWVDRGESGSIVNCGSVLGFAPSPGHFSTHGYAAAKAGLIGLTRSAAAFYAPRNIRCNVLAPALVATPMSQRAQEDPAITEFVKTKQPLDGGRMGVPEDLDGALVWLMSDESRYVTGQVVTVDGGWCLSDGQRV